MGKQVLSILLAATLVECIPSTSFPQEKSPEEQENKDTSESSLAEDIVLGTTSVVISSAQLPLRLTACGATFMLAGLAYLFTIGSEEGRQGPANTIKTVCQGSYITMPKDLKTH